ncbi:MAG: ABC transporter permease, partial [Mixta sp.]
MSSKDQILTSRPSLRHQLFEFLYKWGMLLTVILLIAAFGLASD